MLRKTQTPQRRFIAYSLSALAVVTLSSAIALAQAKKQKPGKVQSTPVSQAAKDAIDPRYFPKPADTRIGPDGRVIYTRVDHMPRLEPNLYEWLNSNVRYPEAARLQRQEGQVVLEFSVDEQGRHSQPVIRKSSGVKELDAEALRVVNAMPDWRPATTADGHAVPVLMSLPLTFKLNQKGQPEFFEGC